jgi:predicted component of type VI protein secretion system
MGLSLVVLAAGKQQGQVLQVKPLQFLVGRDPSCHLRPASHLIGDRHCAIRQRHGKAFLRDLVSTGGTSVNGRPRAWSSCSTATDSASCLQRPVVRPAALAACRGVTHP